MVRRLKKHVGICPHWKFSWKKLDIQISSLLLIFFSSIEVLHMSLSSLPDEISDMVPYAQPVMLAIFVLNLIGRLFVLKGKNHES